MIQTKSTKFFLQGKRVLFLSAILFWVGSIFAQSTSCSSDFRFEINQNTKTISLKASSSHSPAVFGFKLGDGTFLRGEKISHTYATAGDYEVCLTTIAFNSSTNQRCTTKVCKKVKIVDCDRLKANFRFVVDGMTVKFIGQTNSNNASTGFRFGDGQIERKDSVKHTYARPGIYKVCYIAQDSIYGCRKEVCKKVIISAPCDLKATFKVRQDDNTAKFIAEANDRPARFLWSFGDGTKGHGSEIKHDYDKAGSYEVCLTVFALNATNDQICTTRVCKKVTIEDDNDCNLRAKFVYRQNGKAFKFLAKANQTPAKFEWNFGDGTKGNGDTVRHEFDKPGIYKVCLIVYTRGDTPGEVCKTRYCQKVEVKRPECSLKADYAFEKDGLSIKLKARANGHKLHYFWAFGDGTDVSGNGARHTYKKPGKYEVCLIVFDPVTKCKVCICKTIIIEKPCRLKADFAIRQAKDVIAVKARSNGSRSAKYYWDFGDGTKARGKLARHKYTKKGIYVVTLWVADRNKGCKIQIQKRVAIGVRLTKPQVARVAPATPIKDNVSSEVPTWEAKVSPSPARNQVKVSSEEKEVSNVEIYNTDGVIVKKEDKTNLGNVDITLLAPGFYYAHVYAADGSKTVVKFLKN
ncbi:MAG: hypothetical protein COA58_05640 [Bacteroidetes bacterium]|nr:MAG: hypothetical protein COA58_05640 [Bacteroidota bacterium]